MYYFIHSHDENHTNDKVIATQHAEATLVEHLAAVACNSLKATKLSWFSIIADEPMDESIYIEEKPGYSFAGCSLCP